MCDICERITLFILCPEIPYMNAAVKIPAHKPNATAITTTRLRVLLRHTLRQATFMIIPE
jgi:hypothetical protein